MSEEPTETFADDTEEWKAAQLRYETLKGALEGEISLIIGIERVIVRLSDRCEDRKQMLSFQEFKQSGISWKIPNISEEYGGEGVGDFVRKNIEIELIHIGHMRRFT